jgi:formiminoglutamate deiminase
MGRAAMTEFHAETALLPTGWADRVSLQVDAAGTLTRITPNSEPAPNARRLSCLVPGMANLHSHSFQRAMAGLSEVRGPGTDSFWSWRQLMYAFNARLSPEHIQAIAGLVQVEMLEAGFTSVGEFHYLHHAPDGSAYDDPAEISARICAAAATTGIALTLLPVFYRWAGFGEQPASEGQRRFITDPDGYLDLHASAARHAARLDHAQIGIAPHSLRAASIGDIETLTDALSPACIHIHIAEQVKEVEDCLAATGARPVRHLLDSLDIDPRWCLVHATHMDASETRDLARSGAVAGLCPLTEANLGDGLFPAPEFLAAGGRIGIGSDSHIRIDLAEEIRLLEYGQRLTLKQRNVLTASGTSTGRTLFDACLAGGAQALAQPAAGLATGQRADFVELDRDDPVLISRTGDALLDSWLFCGSARQVKSVFVAGHCRVEDGRALARHDVEREWKRTLKSLLEEA